ncbi:MAG: hypothetical protein LBN25_04735 [Christensenellaceae bacterium]|jgi:hypothetical protein|nr:hypothetical protein [Christensenellaceae bacterium]
MKDEQLNTIFAAQYALPYAVSAYNKVIKDLVSFSFNHSAKTPPMTLCLKVIRLRERRDLLLHVYQALRAAIETLSDSDKGIMHSVFFYEKDGGYECRVSPKRASERFEKTGSYIRAVRARSIRKMKPIIEEAVTEEEFLELFGSVVCLKRVYDKFIKEEKKK